MGNKSLLLVLLLQTLSAVRSCDEYATSNKSWCAQYDSKVCQATIKGIKSPSECDMRDPTQPCHLASTTNFLALLTSADAAIGSWIVILYTVIFFGDLIHYLKATSQCFYWSALLLILVDLAVSIGATSLTFLINAQAKRFEDAGCLSLINETFVSLNSIRRDGLTLSYIGILKIGLNIIFAISFAAELASMTCEWCQFKKNNSSGKFAVCGHVFVTDGDQDGHEACSVPCKASCCEERCNVKNFCVKGANWLLITLAVAISCAEAFRSHMMLNEVHSIFIDGQQTGETSWCLHCRSGVHNAYEAKRAGNMVTIYVILACIGGLFLLHSFISCCVLCRPLKEAHGKLVTPHTEDDNGDHEPQVRRATETYEPASDDECWEDEHLSEKITGRRAKNGNKVSKEKPKPKLHRKTESLHNAK